MTASPRGVSLAKGFTAAILVLSGAMAVAGCCRAPSPLVPLRAASMGAPAHGALVDGALLPASGPGFRWLRPEGHHYGVPRLVQAIEDAAAEVVQERPGGAPLVIGDLSERYGGRLPGHRSHRSGRDADLLYFAVTPGGEPVPSPGFVKYGPDGLAAVPPELGTPGFVRLDIERQWLLVRALVDSPDANVQWLFVSRPIEALLIEYAQAIDEDPELVWRAEVVLQQPSDSLPHDDHMHLRTGCTSDEAVLGCEGGGPEWPWMPPLSATNESDESLLFALLEPMSESPKEAVHLPQEREANLAPTEPTAPQAKGTSTDRAGADPPPKAEP
jgi:penicillin-insensitive murein endopeptidase